MIGAKYRAGAAWMLDAILDTIYPELCSLCGASPLQVPWSDQGPSARGLRSWDRPHLCQSCLSGWQLRGPLVQDRMLTDGSILRYIGAVPTTADLTRVIGVWKYHGVRGLAWPLAGLVSTASSGFRLTGTLVPVPLHRRRRRERGFNQAALLSDLLGRYLGIPVAGDLAARVRNTGQQARLTSLEDRHANMTGTFAVKSAPQGPRPRLILVDDVVTSGATTGELALAFNRNGWQVSLVLTVGIGRDPGNKARPVRLPVDTALRPF